MTDETPAAALDLDAIRRDIESAAGSCYHLDACDGNGGQIAAVIERHAPALLAEVVRLRGLQRRPMFWCEGGEMIQVTDPAAFFARPRPVEPFNIPVHVVEGLPPGRVVAISGPHGFAPDGSPIVSAAAADFEEGGGTAVGVAKEDADLFEAWARLNEIISPDRSRFDVLRDELPKCRTRAEAEALIRSEGFGERYPLLPEIDAEVPDRG